MTRADAKLPAWVPLPKWTSSSSVQSFLTSLITVAIAILGVEHPGFHEPSWLRSAIPAVAVVVAWVAHVVVTRRAAEKAAVAGIVGTVARSAP